MACQLKPADLSWSPFWKTTTDDECIRPHVHHRLKTVQMSGMTGLPGHLELARYILLSAHATLESMTIRILKSPVYFNATYSAKWPRLDELANNYLDPQGVHRGLLKIHLEDGWVPRATQIVRS